MFKVTSVKITGFWQTQSATSEFKEDVNIIIGKNGTGKTTFMNILQAVLTVDINALYENIFDSVTVTLSEGKRTRTIRAHRSETANIRFPTIEYHISNRKYSAPLISSDEGRSLPPSMRRTASEETQSIKSALGELVSVASLSVYRIGGEIDLDARERYPRRYASSVDLRLNGLMQLLTQYQLEQSNKARVISSDLQREVLVSLLYSPEKSKTNYILDFDESVERQKLISAYKQLGVSGADIIKKIHHHILATKVTSDNLRKGIHKTPPQPDSKPLPIDISALEAFKLTSTVVEKSLLAEQKTKEIFKQVDFFLKTLAEFMPDKKFSFIAGELRVAGKGDVALSKLSSGEKQLLILFIEALLQRQEPYIFLADEPELSLHISWQRNIIPAIRSINPNAQIVVATHSPEIAGKYRDRIIDMEDILHA